ncbi:hypothetical protein [Catellatospora sichuanensis]|uniref:hypothetical protein n=1 Tax=Catellatospora sichuanensis TaxID=1969805 RepID=UPI00118397AA|nr:hypothetical protein [Catellatospora sichuanensis]
MSRWKRPYRDWRAFVLYPMVIVLAALAIHAAVTSGHPWQSRWILSLVAAVFGILLWRSAREGIYVSADGVRVRRLILSTTVRWAEIRRIDAGGNRVGHGPTICLYTVDGRFVRSTVQPMNAVTDGQAPMLPERTYLRLVDRLRELHRLAAADDPAVSI